MAKRLTDKTVALPLGERVARIRGYANFTS